MQIPDEAIEAVGNAIGLDQYDARAALEAAAPAMAEAVARKILAHMNEHGPAPASPGVTLHETMRRAWRRHFVIAAQVAATAFYTDEDMRRLAAEALARGEYTACDAAEEASDA